MREIIVELMNCFGRNQNRFNILLENGLELCEIEFTTNTLKFFDNIMIFPYQDKLKVSGRIKDNQFSYSEKEKFLNEYNRIKLEEITEKEQIEMCVEQKPLIIDAISMEILKFIENNNNIADNIIEKANLPIDLYLFLNKINTLFNTEICVYENEHTYTLFIKKDRISFNSEELKKFVELLNIIKKKDNKFGITSTYNYNNDNNYKNENCTGIMLLIEVKKSHFPNKKNDKMIIYYEDNKLKYNKLDVPKLYCNYDFSKYDNCDEQIVNDFVISNYYQYNDLDKPIIYSDTILEKLDKSLYNISYIDKNKTKFTISLKYNIKMYIKVNNEEKNGNYLSHSIYFATDNNIKDKTVISLSTNFAQECLNNEIEFDFKGKHYFIEDKEFFGKEIFNKNQKILYVSKDSKINNLYVTSLKRHNKDYESVTYIIKLSSNNFIFKNGYYNSYLDRYYIADFDIENIIDLVEVEVLWPEKKIVGNKKFDEGDWNYNIKSKLSQYGYSVASGVSSKERQKALKNAMEDGMSKYEIVSFLKWLIRLNSKNEKLMEANLKREEDIKYVENYNLNNQRKIRLN